MMERIPEHERRIKALETAMTTIVEWKESIDESTAVNREMIAVGRDIASAIRVLGWVGAGIKWLAAVGAACAVVWAMMRGHVNM